MCTVSFLAAELGFEPRQTAPEAVVLPLHNSAIPVVRVLWTQKCVTNGTDYIKSTNNTQAVSREETSHEDCLTVAKQVCTFYRSCVLRIFIYFWKRMTHRFDFLAFSKMNRRDSCGLLIENHFLTIMGGSDKILSEMKIIFLAS